MSQSVERRRAMEALVGIRKDRREIVNTKAYVRRLRRGAVLIDSGVLNEVSRGRDAAVVEK